MKQQEFTGRDKKPDIEINKPGDKSAWPGGRFPWFLYALLLMGTYYLFAISRQVTQEEIPYSEFLQYLEKGQVDECTVNPKVITGTLTLKDEKTDKPRHFITVPLWNNELALLLEKHGARYSVVESNDRLSNFLLNWVLPFGALFLLWSWILKKMRPGAGFLNIGGNRVHIHADTGPKVTFKDVAGVDEAKQELKETIDFLEDPAEIQRLGGHMPKGVLLVGPPGTGKTLLARAVSGEAGVPFFNISGSEFIEMFVGVGAARVRDLFEQARQKAPCIIFIDELDAIGRSRAGPAMMRSNDERDQTLNQLLVELDGFDTSSGVAVMAATNRPEILDKALLRAGRFDRQVLVDKPDLEDRIAILQIHVRDMKLGDDIDLRVVAQRTPGFVGADLANIANEAALHGVREHHQAIMMSDFEAAIDRVIAGPEKKHRVLSPDEKRRVAFHESGHTLVALSVPTGEPIHKVSIIPRGIGALGYTLQLPVKEKFLQTKHELEDQIAILLGGRTAEEIVFGDISTGAQNDLEKASEIARAMVCRLGMSDKLGPLTYGEEQRSPFLDVEYGEQRNYSEETARAIDLEVKRLVDAGHHRAHEIVTKRRPALDALAQRLEQKEVIGGDEVSEVLRGLMPDEV